MTGKQVKHKERKRSFFSKELMMERLVQDSKVIGSAAIAVVLDYTQAINAFLTLLVTICTLIYVSNRAYHVIKEVWFGKTKEKKHGKSRHKK